MATTLKPFAHQAKSLKHADKSPIAFDCSDPGCVSADTEFLTPAGWKRIDAYTAGDRVAQFHPATREVEFVEPLAYIKKPCAEMIHIAPARGTSQRLSPEHRVLYYDEHGQHGVCSAAEYMTELHRVGPNHLKRKFACTFSVRSSERMPATDQALRLMVAVIADGHFGSKTLRCTIRLKKPRKIERLQRLLAQAGVSFNMRICAAAEGFFVFTFNAPWREKEFGEAWWRASQRQLEVVASELPHWDSNISQRGDAESVRFSTTVEASADFAQYAFAASKMPASLAGVARLDRLTVEYSVHAQSKDKFVGPGRKDCVFLAPNVEGFKYCFEVPSTFLLLRHNGHIFATGNTGKTAVRIWAVEKRIKRRQVKKALVLAPKTLLRAVWKDDFRRFAPNLRVVVSTAGEHEAAFKVPANVYVTNIDAVKWLAKQPKSFFAGFDELIIDESTAYKHHTSDRSKAIRKIAKYFKYRSCLTGTPNSNSITDVWHQVAILDDGKRLGPSFFAFRNAVCDVEQVGRSQHAVRWTDREGAEEVVFSLLSDIVVRHKLEDCTDIPPNHQYTVDFELGPRQRKAYEQMENHAIMELFGSPLEIAHARVQGKKLVPKDHVTAINAAAVATKLLQVASGAVYDNAGKYHVIDTERYAFVLDLVEQRKHSVVFFLWDHQRQLLAAEAEKRGLTFAVIDGSVRESERHDIVRAYQAGAYRTLFLHPKSAGHGLTLTRGTAAIWASPTVDAEFFNQGSRRVYRLSQKQKTETITVLAKGTREERVYHEILAPKQQRMKNLLDLFQGAC